MAAVSLAVIPLSGCAADSTWAQLGINNAADIANSLITASLLNLLGLA